MEESHHNQGCDFVKGFLFLRDWPLLGTAFKERETPDLSCRELAMEGQECCKISYRMFDYETFHEFPGRELKVTEAKMSEWISNQKDSSPEIYPSVDGTLTCGMSTDFKVFSWKQREQSHGVDPDCDFLIHPGKVIKQRARQDLEGNKGTNQPGYQYNASSAANRRGDETEAPPHGQGIDVQDLNGLEPQEPAYNASRGRRVPLDIKQENEKLWKTLNCIVCIDKRRSVVFLPCGHMVLCWDCAVHVEKKCPICQGDILDKKIALCS